MSAHFRLFALVSSGRDGGGGRTEAQMLINHLQYWAQVLNVLLPRHATRLTTTVFDSPVLAERLNDTVMPALTSLSGEVEFRVDPTRTHGLGYYTGAALGIYAWDQMDRINIGDGGFTTWTRDLLSDAKERCLISCIATERVSVIQSAQANRT